jgi:carotenoid 1,2-hydratase
VSEGGPRFDVSVAPGGYAWWYIDALSADGQFGLTVIAFIGSVFSPYYAWSGRRDPENHCAVNVALYGPRGHRWAMTERGRGALKRDASHFTVGPSALAWDGETLRIQIEEITAPMPSRLKGTIRLRPRALSGWTFPLDAAGRHLWRPIAPRADVEVCLSHPDLSWRGEGYFDTNRGQEPLEDAFREWTWSRGHSDAETLIFYDVTRRGGETLGLSLSVSRAGQIHEVEAPPMRSLPSTFWRVPRPVRADAGEAVRLVRTLEDAPFYSRSDVEARQNGRMARIVHESLDLGRLTVPVVRAILPFRMPRRFW